MNRLVNAINTIYSNGNAEKVLKKNIYLLLQFISFYIYILFKLAEKLKLTYRSDPSKREQNTRHDTSIYIHLVPLLNLPIQTL